MPKPRLERVLILSPHTDDGEISAGGTIAKFLEEGIEIYYTAFSICKKSVGENYPRDILKKECREAVQELGIPVCNLCILDFEVRKFQSFRQEILDEMIKLGREISPDLVIAPSSFDTHQDHQVIYNECVRAFKKTSSIWGMEHPWNNLSFSTDIFVKLEDRHVAKKIKALRCYKSQLDREYFKECYIQASCYTRGMNIGVNVAETFQCVRQIW